METVEDGYFREKSMELSKKMGAACAYQLKTWGNITLMVFLHGQGRGKLK